MPLNNRATTTSPLGALGLSPNVQTDSSGNIALGGASSSTANFSIDGISTANVRQNGALQEAYPSQERIAAVKVTAFNNSAEFSQVGDVTFTTTGDVVNRSAVLRPDMAPKVNARFEATFTNVLNHTNFAPPVTAIDNSLFGELTGPQTAEKAGIVLDRRRS